MPAPSGVPGTITTVAGVVGPGLAVDGVGNLYIPNDLNGTVQKVDTHGTITTVAGNGTAGYSGDGGPATSAELGAGLDGVAVDSAGNLYIADTRNYRVRKMDTHGTITTVAGNGTAGYSGDGGPATSAELDAPEGLAVDSAGNLYIAESGINEEAEGNSDVRKVATNGTITTVAGNRGGAVPNGDLPSPRRVAIDGEGNLYIADDTTNAVVKVDANGTVTAVSGITPALDQVGGVAVDSAGNLYIADSGSDNGNDRVVKVDSNGTVTTAAGGGSPVYPSVGDGGPATSAIVSAPGDVAVDNAGNLYIASSGLPGGERPGVRKVIQPPG